jgi:hypothetical protein
MIETRNYSDLINKIKLRTNPEGFAFKKMISESVDIPYSDVIEYIKLSMFGVPLAYTKNSREAANKVKKYLIKSHGDEVDFKLQGSIETNTHILKDNDIDLVQISNKSSTVDKVGLKTALTNCSQFTNTEYSNLKKHSDNFNQYSGNQITDLGELRVKSEDILEDNYKVVDITKPKAIFVEVNNPKRNVDVVTACYYKTVPFMKSNQDYKKGIQVYDKKSDSKLAVEFPFWSIKKINEKSTATSGRLKKMIRLLKNIKFDSTLFNEKSKISSFDINAICFDINIDSYRTLHFLELTAILYKQISKIIDNPVYRNDLMSVDGQETIFVDEPQKFTDLQFLKSELDLILSDINLQTNSAI